MPVASSQTGLSAGHVPHVAPHPSAPHAFVEPSAARQAGVHVLQAGAPATTSHPRLHFVATSPCLPQESTQQTSLPQQASWSFAAHGGGPHFGSPVSRQTCEAFAQSDVATQSRQPSAPFVHAWMRVFVSSQRVAASGEH